MKLGSFWLVAIMKKLFPAKQRVLRDGALTFNISCRKILAKRNVYSFLWIKKESLSWRDSLDELYENLVVSYAWQFDTPTFPILAFNALDKILQFIMAISAYQFGFTLCSIVCLWIHMVPSKFRVVPTLWASAFSSHWCSFLNVKEYLHQL